MALAVLFLYSYTKRFTCGRIWCWVSAWGFLRRRRGSLWAGRSTARMLILCAAVTLWVGGFDVLYACQDIDFDREAGLYSVPKRFGIARALLIARVMHVAMIGAARAGWRLVSTALAGVGGNRGGGRAAGLRAFAGARRRPAAAQCCVFHRKRLY